MSVSFSPDGKMLTILSSYDKKLGSGVHFSILLSLKIFLWKGISAM